MQCQSLTDEDHGRSDPSKIRSILSQTAQRDDPRQRNWSNQTWQDPRSGQAYGETAGSSHDMGQRLSICVSLRRRTPRLFLSDRIKKRPSRSTRLNLLRTTPKGRSLSDVKTELINVSHYRFGVNDTHTKTTSTRRKHQFSSFVVWLRTYVDRYVHILVGTDTAQGPAIDDSFALSLAERKDAYKWLCGEVPIAKDLCHPLYDICSP